MQKQLLPHTTRNTSLAVVAFLLRIPVSRKRVYTEEFLKESRMTAHQAHKAQIIGQVDYAIDTTDPFASRVVQAFNEEKIRIEEGGETSAEFDVDPEVVARIACRVLYARKNFMKDLLSVIPFLRLRNPGSERTTPKKSDGSFTKEIPGFKDIRLDADETTKSHLKLS